MRVWGLLLAALVLAGCGASGPDAPAVDAVERVCSGELCIDHPTGWEVETGPGYIGFLHPDAPEKAKATVAIVSMEAIATNAGTSWPAPAEDVARAFWTLLDQGGVGSLVTIERLTGGSIRTLGTYEGGAMWHLLVPLDGSDAIGVEVRAPNRTWDDHADVFFRDVTAG